MMLPIECKNNSSIIELKTISDGYKFIIADNVSDIKCHIKIYKLLSKNEKVTIENIIDITNVMRDNHSAFDIVMEIAQKYQFNEVKVTKSHILTQDNISIYFEDDYNQHAYLYRIIKDEKTHKLISHDIPIIREDNKHILGIYLDDTQKVMTATIITNNSYMVFTKTFNTVSTAQKHVRDFTRNFQENYNDTIISKWIKNYTYEEIF